MPETSEEIEIPGTKTKVPKWLLYVGAGVLVIVAYLYLKGQGGAATTETAAPSGGAAGASPLETTVSTTGTSTSPEVGISSASPPASAGGGQQLPQGEPQPVQPGPNVTQVTNLLNELQRGYGPTQGDLTPVPVVSATPSVAGPVLYATPSNQGKTLTAPRGISMADYITSLNSPAALKASASQVIAPPGETLLQEIQTPPSKVPTLTAAGVPLSSIKVPTVKQVHGINEYG